MAGSEGMISSLQERETWDAARTTLLLTDHQPVSMETPARIQVEVEHWIERERGSGRECRQQGNNNSNDTNQYGFRDTDLEQHMATRQRNGEENREHTCTSSNSTKLMTQREQYRRFHKAFAAGSADLCCSHRGNIRSSGRGSQSPTGRRGIHPSLSFTTNSKGPGSESDPRC